MRRYLVILFGATILLFGGLLWLAGDVQLRQHRISQGAILRHQLDKLESASGINTVFLGDSTLGNSLDAPLFDRLVDTRSVNLALTGSFGYEASYNLLRRSLERHPVRNVVLVHTFDMMMRPVSWDGFLFTAPDAILPDLTLTQGLALLRTAFLRLMDLTALGKALAPRLFGPLSDQAVDFAVDYLPQEAPIPRDKFYSRRFDPAAALSEKTLFLAEIARLCAVRKLNCLYLHGPLYGPIIADSAAYFDRVNELVAAAGLRLGQPLPLAIAPDEVGDGLNHVHPASKAAFTERYAALLRPQLVPAGQPRLK